MFATMFYWGFFLAFLLIWASGCFDNNVNDIKLIFRENVELFANELYGSENYDELKLESDELDSDLIYMTALKDGKIIDCRKISFKAIANQ